MVAARDGVDLAVSPDAGTATVRTTCPYCGVGCGVLATCKPDGGVAIEGDPNHPANFGRLCSKGSALGETVSLEGRLLHPEIDGERATWDEALDLVAERFQSAIDQHGADSVAFYVSGQILTEDYYVANKLMKGFIGSGNIDTNSRLCMASAVAAHKRAFGTDTVPVDYTDLESADLVLIIGSNLAWCHPVLYQRLLAAKTANPAMRVVVIDPRLTATAEIADLHLPIRPGRDGFLLTWLLAELDRLGCRDQAFIDAHTEGLEGAIEVAKAAAGDIDAVAEETGLEAVDLIQLRDWVIAIERMVTLFSQGINQSSSGTDKGNAIINLHLLTGRIGKPGMGPFSITGQPNAMGGREVGGLATQLAAHIDFGDAPGVDQVHRFWKSTSPASGPGLKAVDLFEAARSGQVKALLIMATNPLVSLPDIDALTKNLPEDLFVAVADCIRDTPTTAIADVLLPAAAWGEKDGTVTNSERRVSRQRAFLPLPGEAKPDWWIFSELGRRLGHGAAFAFETPAQIFREYAGLVRAVKGDLDYGDPDAIDEAAYQAWKPVAWPVGAKKRLFADGQFFTGNGKARFVPTPPRPPEAAPDQRYPLTLNTGRYRDHWHTLTRTGRSPTLSRHRPEPFVEIHPANALALGLESGDFARLESAHGAAILKVRLDEGQREGALFAPMHWNGNHNPNAAINRLLGPITDPVSGQPESKACPVSLARVGFRHQGFALARQGARLTDLDYCSCSLVEDGWLYEIATDLEIRDWRLWLMERLGGDADGLTWSGYDDPASGDHRWAAFAGGRLEAALFVGADLPREWLAARLIEPELEPRDRAALLAGSSPGADPGPLVCACHGIGRLVIERAILEGSLASTEAVGAALKAGTNCGSCLPELRALLTAMAERSSAPAAAMPVEAAVTRDEVDA